MRMVANSPDQQYQCFLMEAEDLDDTAGLEMMLDARFMDWPYSITEETRRAGIDILEGTLIDSDQASFILWDAQNQKVVGRSLVTNLQEKDGQCPEITGLFVDPGLQGRHLVDFLYEGQLQALAEAGYSDARVVISRDNTRSVYAAKRNGFYPVPTDITAGLCLKKSIEHMKPTIPSLDIQTA